MRMRERERLAPWPRANVRSPQSCVEALDGAPGCSDAEDSHTLI